MFSDALASYRDALRQWVPLLSVHLLVRLVTLAILLPLIGLLLGLALRFSDQPALTDMDIALFLLTPVGLIAALTLGAVLIAAAVFDIAMMTMVMRLRARGLAAIMGALARFLWQTLPRLIVFAARFLLRIVLLSVPFLALGGGVAALLLREHDINFYLQTRPAEYWIALGIGALCLAGLAFVLVRKITGWAIALHLCLFDAQSPGRSFALSTRHMTGHRRALLRSMLGWILLRFLAVSGLAAIAGFLLAEGPQRITQDIGLFFLVTGCLILLWALANAALNALANGALADMLNDEFNRYLEARPAQFEARPATTVPRYATAVVVVVGLVFGGVTLGGFLLDRVGGVEDVQVIAHRGASSSRPENTMAAVEKAIEDGSDWVEIDVQETADGAVIVAHDKDFMKAARNPVSVWDVTMDQVAEIDVGSWFDPIYADERPPLLSDVLEAVRGRARLLIELKYYGHDIDLENRVIALVEAADMQDEIATMSLKYPAVLKLQRLRPDWRAGVLAAAALGNPAQLKGDFLAVSASRVSARMIAAAEAAGKDVYVWTVNDATTMSRMISLGVHGLITDHPALAREVIDFYEELSTPERLMLRLGDAVGMAFDLTPDPDNAI